MAGAPGVGEGRLVGLQEGRRDSGRVGAAGAPCRPHRSVLFTASLPTLLSPRVPWGPLKASFLLGVQGQQAPAATPEGRPLVCLEAAPSGDGQCRSTDCRLSLGRRPRVPLCLRELGDQGCSPGQHRPCPAADSVTVWGARTWPTGKAALGY